MLQCFNTMFCSFFIKALKHYSIEAFFKRKGSAEDERLDSELKFAKIRPMRVEMPCKVIPCRNEISRQVRSDGLV